MIFLRSVNRYKLGKLYSEQGAAAVSKLADLITTTRPFLQHLSKAKAGKLVCAGLDDCAVAFNCLIDCASVAFICPMVLAPRLDV